MALIHYFDNPFMPKKLHSSQACNSLHEWMKFNNIENFILPTIFLVNGTPVLREKWGDTLNEQDVCSIITVAPQAPALPYIYLAIAVVSVAMSLTYTSNVPKPNTGEQPDADPVYTLSGKGNKTKLQQPIEVGYGRNRMWPSLAAHTYNKFENDNQYLYSLMVIGQGNYQIHKILVEDTPVAAYKDIEIEIIPPGKPVTLFADNVITSVEVANVELFGANEPEFPGWSGPFSTNPSGTFTNMLEVDITLPNGLYYSNDKGGLDLRTVTATFEYRQIDNADRPIGNWNILVEFSETLATVNAKRFTISGKVPPGRYQVRARRTNAKDTSHRSGNTVMWAALRAVLPDTRNYGNVTLMAVKALASNNLNDNSGHRFNVVATRMLNTWAPSTGWTLEQATRSPVWAFCDAYKAEYGGKLSDNFLDLKDLYQLNLDLEARGINFDWVFDQKSTVWDAGKTIARICRGRPILNGSKLTIVIDEPKTIPVGVFNQENIVKDSFKWDIKLWSLMEYDSVEIEYTDPQTWQPEVIVCTAPGGTSDNPEKITLAGCTDRNIAYREGMYINMSNMLIRENISFQTGLEGNNLTFGDLISVSHDLPRWGQAGYCLRVDKNNSKVIHVSDLVIFEEGVNNYIIFRDSRGRAVGPYGCTQGPTATSVLLTGNVDTSFIVGEESVKQPTLYAFGAADNWSKLCKVVSIKPSSGEVMTIVATNYEPRCWQFENAIAPDKENDSSVIVPDLPVVSSVSVRQLPQTGFVLVRWVSALGAINYIIERSTNGVDWNYVEQTTSTNYTMEAPLGPLYVRVAGVNVGVGPWVEWFGVIGDNTNLPADVTGLKLTTPFIGLNAVLEWAAVADATSYRIAIRRLDGGLLRTRVINALTYSYNFSSAQQDNANARDFVSFVTAINSNGESENAATLQFSNPKPSAITGVEFQTRSSTTTSVDFVITWNTVDDEDLRAYKLFSSLNDGFIPDETSLVYEGTTATFSITLQRTNKGKTFPLYFKVAAFDQWDDQTDFGQQYVIPAT